MTTVSIDRLPHRAGIAAVVAALLLIPWIPTRAIAVFLTIGVLPGWAIASSSKRGLDVALGVGASLSPVLFGLPVMVAMWAGLGVRESALAAGAISLLVFVAFGARPRAGEYEERRAILGAGVVLLLAAAFALSLPITETWWRVREDSWFHAAVADKLARDGLPLADPYFAGLRIHYMYFYHAIVAACSSLSGLDSFRAMILLNAAALTASVFAFHALAGQFVRRAGPRVLATCLWIFGMNGWFYLAYPARLVRAALGETRGVDALNRAFPSTPAGQPVARSLLSVDGNQFMFLDKFMVGTALSLTFGLAATVLLLLVRARRGQWCRRDDVAFVVCIAGAILLHLVAGVTIAVVTALVLSLLLVTRGQPSPGGPAYARLVGWIVLAVAVCATYIATVAPRGGDGIAIVFGVQRAQTVGLFFDLLPALVLAVVFLRRPSNDSVDGLGSRAFAELTLSATGIVALWAALALGIGLTVDLVTNNETKFAFFAYLPLAALAAGALRWWWEGPRSRRLALALVISATLPLHAIYLAHALRDPSTFGVSDEERAVYRWLRERAPEDAVVIEADDVVRVPVLASRDLYWGTEGYARNWGYPHDEMIARLRLRDAMYSGAGPSEVDLARLRALGRPVFVVYRSREADMIDAFERFQNDRRFRGRFATPKIAVWELLLAE